MTTGAAHPSDLERAFQVVRAGGASHHARLLRMTARAVLAGTRWADVIISGHIVCAPAAAALHAIHGTPVVQYFYGQEIPNRPRLASFAARRSACNISISDYTSSLLAHHVSTCAPIVQIPPGVDLPAGRVETSEGRRTVVTVGRLRDRYKGHDVLIEAMLTVREAQPDARLIIVGDGPLQPELEAHSRNLGVDDVVHFAGRVDDAERDEILETASVFCMPSRLREDGAGEGFGIVYMEASARGIPVVAGNVAGARDAVVDGETGLLVDPEDPDAVAQALLTLVEDPQLARKMGEAGRRRADTFDWPQIVRRVEDVVLSLVSTRNAGVGSARSLL